jgi:hypothetical protein
MNLRSIAAGTVVVLAMVITYAQVASVRAQEGGISPISAPISSPTPTPTLPPVTSPTPTQFPTPTPITVARRISVSGYVLNRTTRGVQPAANIKVVLKNAQGAILAEIYSRSDGSYTLFHEQSSIYYTLEVKKSKSMSYTPSSLTLNPGIYNAINFYSSKLIK